MAGEGGCVLLGSALKAQWQTKKASVPSTRTASLAKAFMESSPGSEHHPASSCLSPQLASFRDSFIYLFSNIWVRFAERRSRDAAQAALELAMLHTRVARAYNASISQPPQDWNKYAATTPDSIAFSLDSPEMWAGPNLGYNFMLV